MKQINWGFIGCGEVTEKKSGPAFNSIEGSQIVAVMSRSEQKARSYAERHHIRKWYKDAQSLIDDPDVNAIYIATPPSSHATFAIMAMRAGKPVYVEKPLAASYEDCIRINRISEQTGVPCFVAYYRRYLPYFQRVKHIIDEGEIGKVINVQVRFSVPPRDLDYNTPDKLPWRLQPDIAGGGYFYDLAPHQLDLLQHIFALSLALMAIMPTVPICIKPKTLSLQLSCSKTGCQALAAGVLLVMIVPRKTASRSLAKRVWCRFQCSTTTQSISSQARATGVSRCQILLMFSYQ